MASNTIPVSGRAAGGGPGFALNPFVVAIGVVGYLGRLTLLSTSALRSIFVRDDENPSFASQTATEFDRMMGMGLPLVGLVHVGMGSFLSMQAYFGATFVDGIGPVTGVGLIRNLAPLLTGFIMSGLISGRFVAEFSGQDIASVETARRVAARVAASALAGPVLAVWGSIVGIAIGWAAAHQMMGITLPSFFDMFLEMLWVRDIVGLVVKGLAFGAGAALLACQAGLSRPVVEDCRANLESLGSSACRAACLAGLAILFFNGAWFLLVYHAGPPFGPTVLTPPGL